MKKIYLFIFTGLLLTVTGFSQVTVNVDIPTNTTPNLAASYTSLANAVTAVNAITAMSGPVILTCTTGTETAPAGGYSITLAVATSATNTITFTTSGTVTLTASAALTVGNLNDAIFKLIGADYFIISGFTMQENAANTTNAPAASNNMTEWGVSLLHSSTTNGAQNNTIQNNIITLNKNYLNTFGIYSNARHSATAPTGTNDITNNTTGPNNNNKIYGNSISNVNMGITFIGSNTAANQDVGNDIGGSSVATGNTITNWGGAAQLSTYTANSGTSYCIFSNHQTGDNISYNSITSAAVTPTVTFRGIVKDYTATPPTGTFNSTISNNTVTLSSAATSGTYRGIESAGMGTLSTATVNITNNTILNMTMSGASSSSAIVGIINSSAPGVLNLNNNAVRGSTSTATTGGFTGIQNTGAVVTTLNINNNLLGNGVTGPITFSVATSASIIGISNTAGASTATISISNNTVDGINCVNASSIQGIANTGAANAIVNINTNSVINNTISGAAASATITGISNTSAVSALSITGNIIRGNTSTATTGGFTGIQNTGAVVNAVNIASNQIGSSSANAVTFSAATNTNLQAIIITGAATTATVGVANNSIVGLAGVSAGGSTYGILANCSAATITITVNSLGSASRDLINYSAPSTGSVFGIANLGGAATTNLNITGNTVDKITGVSFTALVAGITNSSSAIGGTLNLNGNAIGTTTGTFLTTTASSSRQLYAMYNSNGASTSTVNMNNNTIDGFFINSTSGNLTTMALNGANVGTALMSGNSFGSTGTLINYAAAQPSNGTFRVMDLGTGSSNATSTMTCQNNTVRNIIHSVTGVSTVSGIFTNSTPLTQTISGNQFINLSLNISGSAWMILDIATRASGQALVINNNSIVTGLAKIVSGGVVAGYYSFIGASANGSLLNITNNNFSNMSGTGSTQVFGIVANSGASASNGTTATITSNTVSNLTAVSNDIIGIYVDRTAAANIANNTLSDYASNAAIYGIDLENLNGQGTINVNGNTMNNYSSTGASGHVRGLFVNSSNLPTLNIYSNSFTNYSTAGLSNFTCGVMFNGCQTANIYDNAMNNYTNAGTSAPLATGINITAGTAFNIYRNSIHTLSATGNFTPSNAVVSGIRSTGGTTNNFYNNFISDLNATSVNYTDAVRGIDINSSVASSNYNVYYNSIYFNASSTGTDFGTSGIYHLTNATATTAALNMIDNIVVNTSTANGAGITAAYRRSDATLTNFAGTSDYNLLYAGTASATKLIYYDGTNSDQTLAAYQTRVSTRDANSISLMPIFTSTTDLHLTPANCRIDGYGTPVVGFTTDYDNATRDAGAPDMGADEFTAVPTPTTMATASICDTKNVSPLGTLYLDGTCNLIAKVLPSGGGTAVNGKIKACTTLDGTQQYHNAQPYVQRHYDIEPVISPATATGTITLYFTDAEFALYNSTNVIYPPLPTFASGGNASPYLGNLRVTQFHGVGSTSPTHAGNYPGVAVLITPVTPFYNGSFWEVTFDVTGFSGFYVHTKIANFPLPILVNYLNGHKQSSNHLINWKVTCTTSPRATMTLERSADGRNYTGINTITADAVRCQQPFDYTDANPLNGMNYYRLKIVDADGKVTYSTTVALLNAVKGVNIISIAPNPVVSDNFNLNVTSATAGKMDIVIFDMQGRLVNRQTISLIAGYNSMPVNVSNLSPGTYTIKGSMADDQSKVIRFVKQ